MISSIDWKPHFSKWISNSRAQLSSIHRTVKQSEIRVRGNAHTRPGAAPKWSSLISSQFEFSKVFSAKGKKDASRRKSKLRKEPMAEDSPHSSESRGAQRTQGTRGQTPLTSVFLFVTPNWNWFYVAETSTRYWKSKETKNNGSLSPSTASGRLQAYKRIDLFVPTLAYNINGEKVD